MKTTIYRKMVLGFGVIILVSIAVNGYLLSRLDHFSTTVHSILAFGVRSMDSARRLAPFLDDEERSARKFIVSGDTLYLTLYADVAMQTQGRLDSLRLAIPAAHSRRFLVPASTLHGRLRDHMQAAALAIAGNEEPTLTEEMIADSISAVRERIDSLIVMTQRSMALSVRDLDAATERALNLGFLITLVTLVGTVSAALFIARTITRPLELLRRGTRHVALGQFDPIPITSRDETAQLARAFNDMSARLKRANEQRTEMLHTISHEIRTPLQAIYSVCYLMTQQTPGPLTDAQRTLMETVRKNVDRIAQFSNQFLDLAKIEAGMMRFQFLVQDPATVLASAVENARLTGAVKNITVTLNAVSAPAVRLDQERMLQVANNLLSNAIKYTRDGGHITVMIGPGPKGVRFTISDTGIGIPEADLPRLFTKFFQASNTQTTGTRGTGLGLALVKAIVEEHGGSISAKSQIGTGTTFTVDLPAAEAHHETAERTGTQTPA